MLNENGVLVIVNAFLENQQYGNEIIEGFGGLTNYIEKNCKNKFQLREASLYYDENILHKDGIVILKKTK